ncbi:MAG TPA: sigma-54 dependent transcriptional regulator [Bacteroidales bacterium]|nr:sigma-54 dependent transcriptional regulator [Bacteroidales bacterium]
MEGNILIADDNKGILNALQLLLNKSFSHIGLLPNPNLLLQELEKKDYDILLLDMNFKAGINTGNEGIYWLREVKKKHPNLEVIMITAYGDIELAVKALKEGAADFVLKPWDNNKLMATIQSVYRLRKSGREIARLKSRENQIKSEAVRYDPVVTGKSQAMKSIMQVVSKVAATEANVLITGENGTGKEVIAKEIHRISGRSSEMFVLVDLSALTETLFESELFGHKKGSFTNAFEDKTGRFLVADKGTLFLDEIGNIPLHMQSKLLTVLQTRKISPVGSTSDIPIDIRLVSATNKGLSQMVSAGQFRQDLLYRLNTIQIHIPPLRERPEDIEDLANHFLKIYENRYDKTGLKIGEDALERLRSNPWPGNIRQLQHTIEKAVILAENPVLRASDFFPGNDETSSPVTAVTLDDMEKKMIQNALVRNAWNQTAAAEQLGITRQTLYNKIKKYGL